MNPLAILGLGAVGVYFLRKSSTASAVQSMKFLLTGVDLTWSGLSAIIILKVKIQNPTNTSAEVRAVLADLTLNGDTLGRVTSFSPITVKALSETDTTLQFQLNNIGTIQAITNLFSNHSTINANIKGTVNVDGSNVPLDISVKIV